MNRLLWSTDTPFPTSEGALPPRQRIAGAPARVLFFNGSELGFATGAGAFETLCAERQDIDAVHVRVPIRGWHKLLGASAPEFIRPWDCGLTRMARATGIVLTRLFNSALPLDRFDVVHLTTQQRGWPITKLAGRVPTKFAVNIDATIPVWCSEFGMRPSPLGIEERTERRMLQRADLVACWSRWVSDSAINACGARPERVTLNKACTLFDEQAPYRTHDETPIRRGTPGGDLLRIVFVGNDWERKGGPRLIRWHQERWKEIAQVHVCSRTAPQDHSLKNVVWHGATPREKLLNQVLPQADLLAMPTRLDTFMIAAQEALAAGLPVVSSALAGLPEVVRHGRTGFLCRADDDGAFVAAIDSLLTNHDLRRRMGREARTFAREHLTGQLWHNHLFDQLVALADGRPIRFAPAGVDIRRSDDEASNPADAQESAARAANHPA